MIGTMRVFIKKGWLTAVMLCGLLLPATVGAEVAATITDVSLGFSGHYKIGYWIPVFVSLDCEGRGEAITIDLTVPDGDGVPSTTTVVLSAKDYSKVSAAAAELYCKIGRSDGELSVVVHQSGRELARRRFHLDELEHPPLPSDAQLLLAIGETPNILHAVSEGARGDRSITLAQLTATDRLPSKWYGYDCVDQVIVCGSRKAISLLTDHQESADSLLEWIRIGGKLLLSIGPGAEHLLKQDGALAALAPGRFVDLASIQQLEAIETFIKANNPLIKEDERGHAQDFSIPVFDPLRGEVLLATSSGSRVVPLLIRQMLGFGQVTFMTLDLEQPEFTLWNGTRKLIDRLLFGSVANRQQLRDQSGNELAHTGYDDLSGQLRAALDRFENQGVRFIPFEVLFLLGVVYLLLIAPGDYLFLKRFIGRMHATWITFPLLIVLTSTGIYFFAHAMKGDRRLINQAELIDIDVATGQIRAACWFSIFSPKTERYNLSTDWKLPTAHPENETGEEQNKSGRREKMLLSWLGLPGTGLGGMESPITTPQPEIGYQYGPDLASMQDVPIHIWSTKCFTAEHQGWSDKSLRADLSVRKSNLDPLVHGTITNLLSTTLENSALFHDGWVYPLGTIKPMQTVTIGNDIPVRTVRNYLARLGPWSMETESERNDIFRIFERITFYHAAGGRSGIPLKNTYLHDMDMTPLLTDHRAVLVGKMGSETFHILNDADAISYPQTLKSAMIRFVLPVQQLRNKKK